MAPEGSQEGAHPARAPSSQEQLSSRQAGRKFWQLRLMITAWQAPQTRDSGGAGRTHTWDSVTARDHLRGRTITAPTGNGALVTCLALHVVSSQSVVGWSGSISLPPGKEGN